MSQLFTKTRKEVPSDEVAKNAQLLIRAGYIHKEMAGVYSYLPLGLAVIKNIEGIIREEMNKIGGMEMKTSILQNKEIWEQSGRWSDEVVDNWFKTQLKSGTEIGLSWTNEEAHASIMKQFINSYKDLPIYSYDFKDIFRNEMRSKSGILRGREFYWKAMYSFSKNDAEHNEFYEKVKNAYNNIFQRVGIGESTYLTFASGGSFAQYSHEFQTITDAGEDTIYVDSKRNIAVNKEVYNEEVLQSLELNEDELTEQKAIEVGNIFSLGTKYSAPFNLTYKDEQGQENLVIMGCYGIGLGRVMGTIAETRSDDRGLVWPRNIAPFVVHIVLLGSPTDEINDAVQNLVKELDSNSITYLIDDREGYSAGEKLSDADLLGMPYRIVISGKSLTSGGYACKKRTAEEEEIKSLIEVLAWLNSSPPRK